MPVCLRACGPPAPNRRKDPVPLPGHLGHLLAIVVGADVEWPAESEERRR